MTTRSVYCIGAPTSEAIAENNYTEHVSALRQQNWINPVERRAAKQITVEPLRMLANRLAFR